MHDAEDIIDLGLLADGVPYMTPVFCAYLAEAARVCLDERGHPLPVDLPVGGSFDSLFAVQWEPATNQLKRTHNDAEVATENGAYGVAFLLIRRLTGLAVIERSRKGTGFDFWIGDDTEELPFQSKARLEVSGIRQGDAAKVASRVRKKRNQTAPTDGTQLPAYIVVVEFGSPLAKVVKK